MLEKLSPLVSGYNGFTEIGGKHREMLMDIGIYELSSGQEEICVDPDKESALLVLNGTVQLEWQGRKAVTRRRSLFDESPWCLHVPRGVAVRLTALSNAEVLLERTENPETFDAKLYTPEDCRSDIFGEGVWQDTARRVVRTVFDYANAPYSKLVIGEVITFPGKWSSYIPHHHPQPEVYYYRFNQPQGFGCAFIGDQAYKITDHSIAAIPGGLVHPQTAAPGYAMYYCWMIRHLENNPWTSRIDDPAHQWLLEPGAKIWPERDSL